MTNKITLTDEQEELVNQVIKWYNDPTAPQEYQYSAPAGAGKSFIMHYIINALGLKEFEVAPMAFSGAAAIVMRRNGFKNAKTIHSSIYRFEEEAVELPPQKGLPKKIRKKRKFVFKGLDPAVKLICLDEASMIDKNLKFDIDRCNKKVLVTGDCQQLPAIHGESAYLQEDDKIFKLTKIMRQAEGSAIVKISQLLIKGEQLHVGNYGQVQVIYRSELERHLGMYVREYGIMLCGTNKTRDHLNRTIRENICKILNPLPIRGEKLICRKNHWAIEVDGINLVNGLYGTSQTDVDISTFENGEYFLMNFRPNFMTEDFKNLQVDYSYFKADVATRNIMRNSLDYKDYEKFEYAYAITTHVSQGSQFDSGIYLQEYFPNHSRNLNYTGITRFRERALYVIPDRRKVWNMRSPLISQCKTLIDIPKVR